MQLNTFDQTQLKQLYGAKESEPSMKNARSTKAISTIKALSKHMGNGVGNTSGKPKRSGIILLNEHT